MKNLGYWVLSWAACLAMFAGCGKDVDDGTVGGETNWFAECKADTDCTGEATCHADVCTRTCDTNSDCSALGATCTDGVCTKKPLTDGGSCLVTPCPSSAEFDFTLCECVLRPDVGPPTDLHCPLLPCPSGEVVDQSTCRCAPPVDSGTPSTCPATTCHEGSELDPRSCECVPLVDSGPPSGCPATTCLTGWDVDPATCECFPVIDASAPRCDPLPCPSSAPWDPVSCSCKCRPLPCPSDAPWNQATCSCGG